MNVDARPWDHRPWDYTTFAPPGRTCPACLRPVQPLDRCFRGEIPGAAGAGRPLPPHRLREPGAPLGPTPAGPPAPRRAGHRSVSRPGASRALPRGTPPGVTSGSTRWHTPAILDAMAAQEEITQRDLRNRSKEIMDAVQNGQAFTVTRDGHHIGELIPLRRRRRFVPRGDFAAMSRTAPDISLDAFRSNQEATAEQRSSDPYAR